jgi:hypothetical protein
MTCKEVEKALPAYVEDVLPQEEKKPVEGHLASCPRCSRALEDLKKTGKLLQGLEEVEPPPWLKQKIVSRMREEVKQQEGIIKKFFYPRHMKIPIQAFAAILIAVLAFYLYKTGQPQMQRMEPLPAAVHEVKKDQVAVESRKITKAHPARILEEKPPIADLAEKDKGAATAPPSASRDEAPLTEEKRIPEGNKPDAAKPAIPVPTARGKEAGSVRDEEAMKMMDIAGQQDVGKAVQAPSSGQKRKENEAYTGVAAKRGNKYDAVPAATLLAAVAAGKRVPINVTVYVRDTGAAVREVEHILDKFDERLIEKQSREGRELLTAEIKGQNVNEFLKELKKIGEVRANGLPRDVVEGNVTVRTEIVSDH